jgi:hypothetical protein
MVENNFGYVGFEVLTVVVMKSTISFPAVIFLSLSFDPEDEGDMFLQNVG